MKLLATLMHNAVSVQDTHNFISILQTKLRTAKIVRAIIHADVIREIQRESVYTLDAEYTVKSGVGMTPLSDAMLIIAPFLRSSI